jgi:N-methylhydantoinase A
MTTSAVVAASVASGTDGMAAVRDNASGTHAQPAVAAENAIAAQASAIRERFEREYRRLYGHALADQRIDFVALRVTVTVPPQSARGLSHLRRALFRAPRAPTRKAYFGREHGLLETPVIDRADLSASPRQGPLIIEEYEGTTLVPPNASAIRDEHNNIVITLGKERSHAQ